MYTNGQIFRNSLATSVAFLRRVMRINREYINSGLNSLVVQYFTKHSQRYVIGNSRQFVIPQHESKPQILQYDNAICVNQPVGGFVPPITSLIGNMLMLFGKYFYGFFAPCTAFLSTCNFTLQVFKALQRSFEILRTVNNCTITKCECVIDTNVDPHGWVFRWSNLHIGAFNLIKQRTTPMACGST